MKTRKYRYFACDFETTVYSGQDHTEVWSAACGELNTDNINVFHTIDDFFDYLFSLKSNIIAYFHNLKFDGNFILSSLLINHSFTQAYEQLDKDGLQFKFYSAKDMPNKSVAYSISDMGQWYTIRVKYNGKIIEFRDSLKLLPFTLKRIGESFATKHKKLEMEYEGERYAGCEITTEEMEYIKNDVYVLKEALEIMFAEGHDKLTIGSCCLSEYQKICSKDLFESWFPNLYEETLNPDIYTQENVGEYIRKAYRGGWCYLAKGKENKIYHNGTTADVNSLYPSMMHSQSGNVYPIGYPTFWYGNYIPDEAQKLSKYYFIRIKTRFYIKPGYLPFIQIKNSFRYIGTESLETSDYFDRKTQKYYKNIITPDGEIKDTRVELTMTQTDFALLLDHYNLEDFEIISGCYFEAYGGIFDEYIDKYKQIKMTSKNAKRELAKLFLNNLYGKMASSTKSDFKIAYIKEGGTLGFQTVLEDDKKPGYIPVGAAITSYARNFTIRAAQANYHGKDKPGFIYADTDSIHCDLPSHEIKGIKVDDKEFCCWKLESGWDTAIFARQKTYIEHITIENNEEIKHPYYNIKCAGMPDKCKQLFNYSMLGTFSEEKELTEGQKKYYNSLSESEKIFVEEKRDLSDFKLGLIVPGKLRPVRIPGGVVLVNTTYEIR